MHSLAFSQNIVFIVLVAIVGLLRWISQASENRKNDETAKRIREQRPNAPPPRAPVQSEEERVRKFMEALGVPTSNAPPTKTPPRRVAPTLPRQLKREIQPIDPFPRPQPRSWFPEQVFTEPEPTPVILAPPESIPEPPLPTLATSVIAPLPVAQSNVGAGLVDKPIADSWAARFANSKSLRDAIILREIFGPPRSQQAFDLHSLG